MNTFTERQGKQTCDDESRHDSSIPFSLSLSPSLFLSLNVLSTDEYMPIVVFALIKKLKHFRNMREISYI